MHVLILAICFISVVLNIILPSKQTIKLGGIERTYEGGRLRAWKQEAERGKAVMRSGWSPAHLSFLSASRFSDLRLHLLSSAVSKCRCGRAKITGRYFILLQKV